MTIIKNLPKEFGDQHYIKITIEIGCGNSNAIAEKTITCRSDNDIDRMMIAEVVKVASGLIDKSTVMDECHD